MKWKIVARWAARILSILLILFFLVFSFDEPIFSLGFLMHNIPTIIILIAAIIAWKREKAGGIIYLLLGIFSIFFFNIREHLQAFLITAPFILIGILFLISAKKDIPPTHSSPSLRSGSSGQAPDTRPTTTG
jgi:hypothetical protein